MEPFVFFNSLFRIRAEKKEERVDFCLSAEYDLVNLFSGKKEWLSLAHNRA